MDTQGELLRAKEARLRLLEVQAARFGYSTPPEVVMEIDSLREEIAGLQGESPTVAGRGGGGGPVPDELPVITIAFLSADPTDASRLRSGQEIRDIREQLQLAKLPHRFRLEERFSVRPRDFVQALLDEEPRIVHFSGHGAADGGLCLENDAGELHPVSAAALRELFRKFTGQVECVLLNACYSEVQGRAIAEHIDYVIGMSQAIGDRAAIAFATGFYQALGAGRDYEDAFDLGKVQLDLLNIPEALTPVLLRRTPPGT